MGKRERKPKSKLRKILEWIGTIIVILLVAGCASILIISRVTQNKTNPTAPSKIGDVYLPLIVKTDSMEPKYKTNTAIFIQYQSPESIYAEYQARTETTEIDLTFDDYYMTVMYPLNSEDNAVLSKYGKNERTTASSPMRTMTHRLFYMKINEGVAYGQGKYYFFVAGINDSKHQSQSNQYQIFTEVELYGRVTGNSDFLGAIFSFATSPWGLIILLLIPCLYMIISSVIDLFRSEEEKAKAIEANQNDALNGISEKDKERLKKELLNKMIEEKKAQKEKENVNADEN